VAEENIDNTLDGSGLFNTKIPGLSDPADIQSALRLYHYGSYNYVGSNTNPANLEPVSMAKHLQNLKTGKISFSYANIDAFPAAALHGGHIAHAILTGKLYFAHNGQWVPIADEDFVTDAISEAIDGVDGSYPSLVGVGLYWNADTEKFDVEPRIANVNTVVTKTTSFSLSLEDVSKTILLNTSSTMILDIPSNSSLPIPIGYQFNLIEIGSGRTTFTPSSGVTINSKNSQMYIDEQYGRASLLKISTDGWILDRKSVV
jgi:hypothetical protein